MKKVFLVERTDKWGYDEYDSCVMVAESKEEVEAILFTINLNNPDNFVIGKGLKYNFNGETRYLDTDNIQYDDMGEHTITEIDLNNHKTGVICSSYNAG